MSTPIRIGTRDSQLARWQASRVQTLLKKEGVESVLIPIHSEGDLDLTTPLYEMGVQGIFTRSLDQALLAGKIDIAVHSMKDVPTKLPAGIVAAAVLERGPVHDLLAAPKGFSFLEQPGYIAQIGTSSLRRRAQWLRRYPGHQIQALRGNMQTRLRKLQESGWDAAIFAQAGLERIGLRPEQAIPLDWMLPAPAQGAILVVAREGDATTREVCAPLRHEPTAICAQVERDFLRGLLGGCSTPVGALAEIQHDRIQFRGNLLSPDGREMLEVRMERPLSEAPGLGFEAARDVLSRGGDKLNELIRLQMKQIPNSTADV